MSMANEAGTSENNIHELYRELPSVDRLVGSLVADSSVGNAGHDKAVFAARYLLDQLRLQIAAGHHDSDSLARQIQKLSETLAGTIVELDRYALRPVINATGVILHTNLGRAPLSQRALEHILETAGGYCNLEFDLSSGKRGRRERITEERFLMVLARQNKIPFPDLKNKYGLFVANNCAAAIFLTLNALAAGGEVLVSRGELIEIGGGFRIPEILERAGATLREVGTTNKTRLEDYESAVTERTKLILRVHRSNFRISGFTERPDLSQLVRLGERRNLPVVEDQGTGALASFTTHGLGKESVFSDSVVAGADVICASGDKLLGGPQAGLIFGRRHWIKQISSNPLARAFRVDKMTYAALEATLLDYATGSEDAIPVLHMMRLRPEDILQRAEALAATIDRECVTVSIRPGHSVIGGGTAPGSRLRTHLVQITHRTRSASALLKALRESSPALIARVAKDHVLLDLRTVAPQLDPTVTQILNSVLA
jgi:L-seryl-tRNA(Ser) seleniumtransferase